MLQFGEARRAWGVALWRARILLRSERRRRWLGMIWWLLEPAFSFLVFWVVFHLGLRAGGDGNYLQRLATGLVVWRWYEQSLLVSSASLISARSEYLDLAVPKLTYPLSSWMVSTFKFLPVFALVWSTIWLLGWGRPSVLSLLTALLALSAGSLLILGSSLLLSAVVPFLPDLRPLLEMVIRLQFFASDIVFPLELLPGALATIAAWNPVTIVIRGCQSAVIGVGGPDWGLIASALVGSAAAFCGIYLLEKWSGEYGKLIS